jgi:CheY-like chemotaxis protein
MNNITSQLLSRQLPGRGNYNPAIIFSTNNPPNGETGKNKLEHKDIPLKSDTLYIILADDDQDDRELFSEVIGESGINVKLECAEDGKELISLLESPAAELPNMIFLDLNMPNKGGKECLEVIRNSKRLQDIPVIIYSTSSSPNDINETFDLGANLYVRKPTSYSDLLTMARTVLNMNWDNYKPKESKTNFVFSVKTK